MAVLQVLSEVAAVLAPISLEQDPLSVHLVGEPEPSILAPIAPVVAALALHRVCLELALKEGAVVELTPPVAMFFAFNVLSCEARPVVVDLLAGAVLLAGLKLAFEDGAVRAEERPPSLLLVVLPVAHVDFAIFVDHAAVARLDIVDEEPVESTSIWPDLRATAVSTLAQPLTSVEDLRVQKFLVLLDRWLSTAALL